MSLRTTHVLGLIGAVVVFVATAITWYTHDISVAAQAGQVGFKSSNAYTLWDFTTLAPVLLVIAAGVGAVLLFVPSSAARTAGTAAGIVGLAIAAYCVVRMFDFPDLGTTGGVNGLVPLGSGAVSVAAHASTTLGAGPFIGLLGGALMAMGGLGLASEAPEPSPVSRSSGASAARAQS
jgi:hypothetical protein